MDHKHIVFLLVLGVVAVHATFVPAVIKERNVKRSNPEIPGLDQSFGHGIDRKDGLTRAPLFNFAFTDDKTWTNPLDSTTYSVPDNVEVASVPSAWMDDALYVMSNFSDVIDTQRKWSHFGIGIPCFGIDFSYTAASGHLKEELMAGTHVVYTIEREFAYYRMQTYPVWSLPDYLNAHFTGMINSLPTTCASTEDKKQYEIFRETFGTDYAPEADMGGVVSYVYHVNKALFKTHTEDWVYHNVELAIEWDDINIGFNIGKNKSDINMDSDFLQNMHKEIIWGGGNTSTNYTDYHNWSKDVINSPMGVHPRLAPIYNLLEDAHKSECLKAEVESYMTDNSPPSTMRDAEVMPFTGPKKFLFGVPHSEGADEGEEDKEQDATVTAKASVPHRPKAVRQARRAARKTRATHPNPAVQGFDVVGYGYDAVEGRRRVLPVYDQTFTRGKQWTNPQHAELVYDVPDQVQVMDIPAEFTMNLSVVTSDAKQYQEQETHTETHHHFFSSRSKTTYNYYQHTYQQNFSLTERDERHVWYRLSTPPLPPPALSDAFLAAVDALPAVYDNTSASVYGAYMEFLNEYGTHVINEAYMGGSSSMQTWYHSCFVDTYTDDWVSEQSGWSFIIISDKHGRSSAQKNIDADFWSYSDSRVRLEGGMVLAYNVTDLPSWRESLSYNMAPVQFSMEPIGQYLTDKTKKANIDAAITDYMQGGEVLSLEYQAMLDRNEPMTVPDWCHW